MINADMHTVSLLTPSQTGQDEFGAPVTPTNSTSITMAIYPRVGSTAFTSNLKYTDSTHIGLTPIKDIPADAYIADGQRIYNVDFVNSAGRLTQVFLTEKV